MGKIKIDRGITLVALIITIIILLILAGVAIAQLTGNGLFEKTKLAKEKHENAQELENAILGDYETKIGEYVDGSRDTITLTEEELNNKIKAAIEEKTKWNKVIEVIGTEEQTFDFTKYEEVMVVLENDGAIASGIITTNDLTGESKVLYLSGHYTSSSAYSYSSANISNLKVSIRSWKHTGTENRDTTTMKVYVK